MLYTRTFLHSLAVILLQNQDNEYLIRSKSIIVFEFRFKIEQNSNSLLNPVIWIIFSSTAQVGIVQVVNDICSAYSIAIH